ncbi:MAG TPA: iron-siderophore ABC transporter substrate-binding protein [Candidatus Agrococcus pullicola]|uniref:Iron-siderophore ABC transporter substrate-binding protein n=1 Tax=Candidatus Agrococcus pullicola TaxID=2838429 RepID=A0A9D2CA65_9MICO|nr:iron-siderophore ABC transporter substrate-binding protein [Candidatus Agrococcus pullicola]
MLRRLAAGSAALLLLALTACGSGGDTPDDGENAGETRVVEHLGGETEVPVDPERVTTLWAPSLSAMLSMGEAPYAYAFNAEPIEGLDYPEGFDIDSLEHVGHSVELEFESIAAVAPDLIIGTSVHEEHYETLSRIAPTVILEWDGTGSWKDHLHDLAEVLGAEESAEQVESDYQNRVDEVIEAIGNPGDIQVSVIRFHAEELRLEVLNSYPGMILSDIGLARPDIQNVEEPGSGFLPVSMENLPDADGDVIFAYTIADADPDNDNLLDEAQSNPLWNNLDAVQNDAVFSVDYNTWLSANYIGAHRILDDLEEHLGQ